MSAQNGGLHGSSVRDGLIGVDGLAGLLAVEKVGHQLLHLGNASRSTDQHDLVDAALVNARVLQDLERAVLSEQNASFQKIFAHLLDGHQSGAEQVGAQLLKASASDLSVKVLSLKQRVNLDGGLSGRRQRALGTFASRAQTTNSARISANVMLNK